MIIHVAYFLVHPFTKPPIVLPCSPVPTTREHLFPSIWWQQHYWIRVQYYWSFSHFKIILTPPLGINILYLYHNAIYVKLVQHTHVHIYHFLLKCEFTIDTPQKISRSGVLKVYIWEISKFSLTNLLLYVAQISTE